MFFDMEDPGSSSIFTTKAVYGIQLDPFRPHRFLSHSEDGLVNVWDRRKAAGPLLAFQADCRSQMPVVRFSPTQSNQIAVLDKEDSRVRLFSLADARDELAKEAAPVVWKSRQVLESQSSLTSFCWVPVFVCGKSNQELLCLTREGALETYPVRDASSVAWSPMGIATAELSRLSIYSSLHAEDAVSNQHPDWDMASVMHSRAKDGYGLDPSKNKKICTESPELTEVWEWVERICQMQEAGQTKVDGVELAFQGLATILSGGPSSRAPSSQTKAKDSPLPRKGSQSCIAANRLSTLSEIPIGSDVDADLISSISLRKTPSNPSERQRPAQAQPPRMLVKYRRKLLALDMLNRFDLSGRDDIDGAEANVANLEDAGQWERAAKCALLMVSLDRAVEVLQRSGVERHRLMAAALSGRSQTNTLWSEQIRVTALSLPEPSLQAVFLYAWRESWADVLEHTTLPLRDCLWIAIRFLEADDLRRYLEQSASELVLNGYIAGVLLTGLQAPAASDLIASYVDHTGDVQSAALLLSLAPRSIEPRVATCVEFYRGLLDQWGMWRARCSFDIGRRHAASRILVNLPVPPPQVVVRCNFCNANIGPPFPTPQPHNSSPNLTLAKARRSTPAATSVSSNSAPPQATASSTPQKPTACPNCKKPLPRCALCLLHLGTPADPSNPSSTGVAPPLGATSTVPLPVDNNSPTTPLSTGSVATSNMYSFPQLNFYSCSSSCR
ncbi:hypothetical protein DSO57_1036837 [Entomophthora muscae]|uniref:Uncharacterized protein n=1 Tax=Entomophthora muscae TaxID=34485 RepID=A0ACC2TX06_9FUNG|nr:hypothetical protein DSO57_1036837 [Entomophthora muscae]